MAFGDVLQTVAAPVGAPRGIGGNATSVWGCTSVTDKVFELSPSDLSEIRRGAAPSTMPNGIGGDDNTIWETDINSDKVYELAVSDLSEIRQGDPPRLNPAGIGGDSAHIWGTDPTNVWELNITDFSLVREVAKPAVPPGTPEGAGGDGYKIWWCAADRLHELSPADLSSVRNVDTPGDNTWGVGGDAATIWLCDYSLSNNYQIDAAPVCIVSVQQMTDVRPRTATGHGTIVIFGVDGSVIEHGHCWDTAPNPTTADSKTELGTKDTLGAFSSPLTDLAPGTQYYVRAYVRDSVDTYYSDDLLFVASSEILRPNAVGDICGGSQVGEACPDHWKNVDELETDEDTAYVYGAASGYQEDLYNLPNHSVGLGRIEKINVWARLKAGIGAIEQKSAKIEIKTGALTQVRDEFEVTHDWTDYKETWTTNPDTGNPWTWAEIDALQIGVRLRNCPVPPRGGEPRTAATQVWLEVVYQLAGMVGLNPAAKELMGV